MSTCRDCNHYKSYEAGQNGVDCDILHEHVKVWGHDGISIEPSFGCNQHTPLRDDRPCSDCNGSGKSRHFWEEDKDCSVCGGAGASPIRDRETGK